MPFAFNVVHFVYVTAWRRRCRAVIGWQRRPRRIYRNANASMTSFLTCLCLGWPGLAFFSVRDVQMVCLFFFSLISFYLHFVSPILFLLKLFKHYIYTYVKMLRGCSMSLEQLASPVLLFFFLYIYQIWNVMCVFRRVKWIYDMISSHFKMIQEAL